MSKIFRKGQIADITAAFKLYEDRIRWMDEVNIKQWNTTDYLKYYPMSYFKQQAEIGNFYVIEDTEDGRVIGAVVLLSEDPRWDGCDYADTYYVHNLVTDVTKKGTGRMILSEVERIARGEGKKCVRLDCSVDNEPLNIYYESQGYMPFGEFWDGEYNGLRREKTL